MMSYRLPVSAALVLAVASCQGVSPGKPVVGGPGTPAAASPKGAPAKPGQPGATGTASPTPKAATMLAPLAGQAVRLMGQVLIDDRYATTRGGASRLVGPDGATLVGMDGASLIGPDGASLVGPDGASLVGADGATLVAGGRIVAAGGGNVVVPAGLVGGDGALLIGADGASLIGADGASLVGPDGASLVGPDGASLVGPDGASLIGPDGASLVGNDAGSLARAERASYALAQQAPATAFGEQRPAAGMWVSVVDVRTGLTVPLGKDAAGADVHTIYTNASGKFAVSVDPALAAHLRVVARAPGRRDPRLVLNVITAAGASERRIDEQEAAVASFLRTVAARRLAGYFGLTQEGAENKPNKIGLGIASLLAPIKAELEAVKAGPNGEANLHEVCLLLADRIILTIGYENLALSNGLGTATQGGMHPESRGLVGRKVVAELRGMVARLDERVRAQAAGQADPVAFFAAKPYLIAANLGKAPEQQYLIERPVDMLNFIVREYLSSVRTGQDDKFIDVFEDLGMSLLDHDRVEMAGPSLFEALLAAISEGNEGGGDEVAKMAQFVRDARMRIARVAPRPVPIPGRTAPPVSAPAAEPPRKVETIAGHPGAAQPLTGQAIDGPGLEAYLGLPSGLALDERGERPVLYAVDVFGIRRLTFDAVGAASVMTLAGTPGKFGATRGLAFDGKGALYVADGGGNQIFRVSLPAEGPSTVVAIAGDGVSGFRDGPGAQARLSLPTHLTFDPQGDLLVADANNNRVRRISLGQPDFPVSTLLGDGQGRQGTGPLAPAPAIPGAETQGHPGAAPEAPVDVGFGPDGAFYLMESTHGFILRVPAPLGPTARAQLVAGGRSSDGSLDGFYHNAGFAMPGGFAFDPKGRLVVADGLNHRIRLVTPDGWVSTLAGGGPTDVLEGSHADGPADQARFNLPADVAVAKDGTIYVADYKNHVIRRIMP